MAKWTRRTKLPRHRRNCKHKQRISTPILPRPLTGDSSLLKTGCTLLSAVALSTQLLTIPVSAAEQPSTQPSRLFDGRSMAVTKTSDGITSSSTITPSINTKETPHGKEQKLTGGAADLSLEKDGWWRFTLGGYYNADNSKSEMRLATSMSLLYAASKLGTYVGYEKGRDFDKFLIAEGFKVPGGKVLITGALLKRLVEVAFSETNSTYVPKLEQKALGIDYTAGFSKEGLIEEIKTTMVFFDVDGKNLGSIGTIVLDDATQFDQTRVFGGVRGGNKLLGEASIALRLATWLRADLGAGGERREYDAMFDRARDTKASAVWTAKLIFQPNEHHRLRLSGSLSDLQRQGLANYIVDFGYYLQAFVEGSYNENRQGIEPERRVMAGFTITLDGEGKKSKLAPLFSDLKGRDSLKLPDLVPTGRVTTNQIEVMEKVSFRQHEINIDKTILPGTSYLEKNADGSLRALNLDTGVANLVSVVSVNYAQHTSYFSINAGRYLRIANFEKLAAPATYQVVVLDNLATNTLIQFTTVAGSVQLKVAPQVLNGVSAANAAAFIAGTKTFAQIQAEMAAPDTTPDAFTFVDQTGVALGSAIESAAITVSGINAAATISVSGGEYAVSTDGGGSYSVYTAAGGTVNNGNKVKVRHTSSAAFATATNTTLTIGWVSDEFRSTTEAETLITTAVSNLDLTTATDTWVDNTDNITKVHPAFTWNAKAWATSYVIQVDAGAQTDIWNVLTYQTAWLSNGSHTFKVWPKNAVGIGTASSAITFTLDSVAPAQAWTNWISAVPSLKSTSYSASVSIGESGSWIATNPTVTSLNWGTISSISVSGNTVSFTYVTPNAVDDTITISGTDKAGNAYSVSVDTAPLATPNAAPTGPALSNVTVNDNGWFGVITIPTATWVSDANGHTLTYSASGFPQSWDANVAWLPQAFAIDSSTWVITWRVNVLWQISKTITVTVSDWNWGTLVRTFNLTINDNL